MKNILFRSKTTPFDIFDPITFIEYDKCGSNLGNLLYQHSVYKHLSTEDQHLTVNNNSVNLKKVDFINQNYDHFVIPLANAFRPSFAKNLEKLTHFLKGIKIPITIVGVGAQTDHTGNFENLNAIKPKVKEFLSVVLDKGESIGVRGAVTQQYIESLGFQGKADIIGCPSLFTYPDNIINMHKSSVLNENPKLAINLSATGPQAAFSKNLNNFEKTFTFNFNRYSQIDYIPQETRSLELLTYGVNRKKGIEHSMLSASFAEKMFKENKVKFFLNSYSWFEYLGQCDFTFGTRLHGCIASLIGGTPALLFAHDSRTLEIAEYFALPYINLNHENRVLDAKDLYELVDLEPMKKKYDENLKTYANFLRKHGLDTIVDNQAKMQEFDSRVTDEMRSLYVEPLSMTNQSIGARLHWLKDNYDFKLSKLK
ncbi:polysaccharide pyruvyl transferase family protein [Acinetobacter thermotolerans]|uniref:polysaccharide pyruvyl transferase family protein n=1 Tax=Acinetobacter thermotolerans TaxID=3151487 RepID=UPI00325ADB1D